MLLYGCMDQYCKHNGIPLGAHFIYLNFDSILPWWWLYLAEKCRRTKNWYCHYMIRIFVFVDWPKYYCIDITKRDDSYLMPFQLLSISHLSSISLITMNNILIVTADYNRNIGAPHRLSWVSHVFFDWRICKSLLTTLAVTM
jgi:hypothetical protein